MSKTAGAGSSRDGARIAVDRSGDGPPVSVVDGAFCSRETGPGKGRTDACYASTLDIERRLLDVDMATDLFDALGEAAAA